MLQVWGYWVMRVCLTCGEHGSEGTLKVWGLGPDMTPSGPAGVSQLICQPAQWSGSLLYTASLWSGLAVSRCRCSMHCGPIWDPTCRLESLCLAPELTISACSCATLCLSACLSVLGLKPLL